MAGVAYTICPACHGMGAVKPKRRHGSAASTIVSPDIACVECAGTGLVESDGCDYGASEQRPSLSPPPPAGSRTRELAVLPQSPPILIAGAGIGGLALALALEQRGIRCIVLERDAHAGVRSQVRGCPPSSPSLDSKRLWSFFGHARELFFF